MKMKYAIRLPKIAETSNKSRQESPHTREVADWIPFRPREMDGQWVGKQGEAKITPFIVGCYELCF